MEGLDSSRNCYKDKVQVNMNRKKLVDHMRTGDQQMTSYFKLYTVYIIMFLSREIVATLSHAGTEDFYKRSEHPRADL